MNRVIAVLSLVVLALFAVAVPAAAHNTQPCGTVSYGLVATHPKPCPTPTPTPSPTPSPTPTPAPSPTPSPTPFCSNTGNFCAGQPTPTPQPSPSPTATPPPDPSPTPDQPTATPRLTLPPTSTDAGSGPSLPGGANGAVLAFFGLLAVAGVALLVVYPRKDRGR